MSIAECSTVAIVANGVIHDCMLLAPIVKKQEKLVAVDGGLVYCSRMNLIPDIIVGDMDSVPPALLEKYPEVPKKKYLCDKDYTDLELAIEDIYHPKIKRMVLFGAVEGRVDHFLFNIQLLRRYPGILIMETETATAFVIDHSLEVASFPGQTVSLLPIGSGVTVTTEGLKWELNETFLDYSQDQIMSLSNISLTDRFKIELKSGHIMCIMQRKSA